jgi:hypothetical protein
VDESDDGGSMELTLQKTEKCVVIKTTTRQVRPLPPSAPGLPHPLSFECARCSYDACPHHGVRHGVWVDYFPARGGSCRSEETQAG